MEVNNTNYQEIFEHETNHSYINKLFWIAAQMENDDLNDLIGDLNEDQWFDLLPDLRNSKFFLEYFNEGNMKEMLFENGKFGFIAKVNHPNCTDFKFNKNGEFSSCSIEGWRCRISYVYAETIDELTNKIKEVSEKLFQEMIDRDKEK